MLQNIDKFHVHLKQPNCNVVHSKFSNDDVDVKSRPAETIASTNKPQTAMFLGKNDLCDDGDVEEFSTMNFNDYISKSLLTQPLESQTWPIGPSSIEVSPCSEPSYDCVRSFWSWRIFQRYVLGSVSIFEPSQSTILKHQCWNLSLCNVQTSTPVIMISFTPKNLASWSNSWTSGALKPFQNQHRSVLSERQQNRQNSQPIVCYDGWNGMCERRWKFLFVCRNTPAGLNPRMSKEFRP